MSDIQEEQLIPVTNPILKELESVHDIPMRVCIEVGRLKLTIKEFMKLAPESVLDLKKVAGEPFEITINGLVIARGEVVMVEQSSGVRIVEIVKSSVTA